MTEIIELENERNIHFKVFKDLSKKNTPEWYESIENIKEINRKIRNIQRNENLIDI